MAQIRHPIVFSPDDTNTSCLAGDPLDEMRNIIDRDIARLEENIRALRSRRNELSPIYRLPAEILCNIFSLTEDLSQIRSPESWTNFSQVSQRWRSSALSAPELWTKISLSHSRWAKEMLIRSKMAKLTIRSDLFFDNSNYRLRSNPKTIESVRSCLYEMDRVEEIKLTAFSGSILKEIFRDLPKSAPQLHTLCIGYGFSMPEDFLYDTERLRCVELCYCEISWDSRLLTGLTRLTLEDSLKANTSIIQVLRALQRMPALTELHLEDSIPDDSGGDSTCPVIDLPCLRILHISSWVGPLTTVLRHITFPHSAILNLTCAEKSTQIDFSNFLSVLATKFMSSLVIRSLQVREREVDGCTGLKFYLWTTAFIQDCFPSPSSLKSQSQLELVLTWPRTGHNHGNVLISVFNAMRLHFLTQLQISTSRRIDSQTWVKFLESFLYWNRCSREIENSLPQRLVSQTSQYSSGRSLFPHKIPKFLSVEILFDCLMERCERNAEIQVLRLDDCFNISSDDVKRLEEIVDVIWDGVEFEESKESKESDSDY